MITDLGRRHVKTLQERLSAFQRGDLSLRRLILDVEALLGLLFEEADPNGLEDLEIECNRLELVNATAVEEGRSLLTDAELTEVAEAVDQLRQLSALLVSGKSGAV